MANKKQYTMLGGLILGLIALIFLAPNLFNGLFPGGLVKAYPLITESIYSKD